MIPAVDFPGSTTDVDHDAITPRAPIALLTVTPARPTKIVPLLDGVDLYPCVHADEIPADVNTVLLCGRKAVEWFRPDLLLEQVHGSSFVRRGRVYVASLHPSDHPSRVRRADVEEAVEGLRFLLSGDLLPTHLFGTWCVQGCGGLVDHYDPEGAPWCVVHWGKRAKTPTEKDALRRKVAATKVKAARKRIAERKQGGML